MINHPAIERSKDILNGMPVFAGTRVPVQTLIDYLEAGSNIFEFMADFPTVKKEQILQVLEAAKKDLLN